MSRPTGFSWIDRPKLAALARPDFPEELAWLRQNGIELVLSLTEDPLPRHWVADASLLALHVPIPDMEAPTPEQIETCVSAIRRAHERHMGVAIHCAAGLGRTGVILACYFVAQGQSARAAIDRVRDLRPGSIETDEQLEAIEEFERRSRPRK
jgi:atypical dual specificity phosphatase